MAGQQLAGAGFWGALPSALGMRGPAPIPRVWLFPAYVEELRSVWGCSGAQRQHLHEGAQRLQSKTEMIYISSFQPSFLQIQCSDHHLACVAVNPPLKPPCQLLPNLHEAQRAKGKSFEEVSRKHAAG